MTISVADWQKLHRLLDEALDLEPAQRIDWVDSLSPEYDALRGTLRSMLLHGSRVETAQLIRGAARWDPSRESQHIAEDIVGPYRLLREIGSGGMATVWLAERADGALQRVVALKLPRVIWIDGGLATRMLRERDILASLEHPHIARLYDAGTDAHGRPYLAIEYVDGVPLDVYVSHASLTIKQRLELFLQIARAVAFAHTQLIVHRDLKPTNILVKPDGSVRLLDFGIARLLQLDAVDEAPPANPETQMGLRLMTPRYAAPEQFLSKPVSVATDIYSLGVLLYEILAGVGPYVPKSDLPRAFEDAVLDDEPALMSKIAPTAERRALRGDLDAIVSKALKKSPTDRYASVEAFANDIERHLAGLPIATRAPSRWYVTQKFIRRNVFALAAAASVVVALSVGLGAAVWQWREAAIQRQAAVDHARTTESTLEFASTLLTEGIKSDETVTLDELLSRAEALAMKTDRNRKGADTAVDLVSGWYMSYGQYEKAEKLLTRTIDALPAPAHTVGNAPLFCKRAVIWSKLGRIDEAVASLTSEIERAKRDARSQQYCLQKRAEVARDTLDGANALKYSLAALARFEDAGMQSLNDKALLLGELGFAQSLSSRADLAQQYYAQALALFEQDGRAASGDAVAVLNNWGIATLNTGDPQRALQLFERATSNTLRGSPTGSAPQYLIANRATALRLLGRYAEADDAFEVSRRVAQSAGDVSAEIFSILGEARAAVKLGKLDEAQALVDAAAEKMRAAGLPENSPLTLGFKSTQSQILMGRGQPARAAALLTQLVDFFHRTGCCGPARPQVFLYRADAALAEQRLAPALDDAQVALRDALKEQGTAKYSYLTGSAWLMLARIHDAQGQRDEARAEYSRAAEHLSKTLGDQHADTQLAKRGMAASLQANR